MQNVYMTQVKNEAYATNKTHLIDKRQVLKAFNDHFIHFLEDVERVFPGNQDITSAKHAIIAFRKMNPRLLVMVFYESVGKMYRSEIESGNLHYFIEKDYTPDVKGKRNADILIQKINSLREPVNNMSKSEQEKVIKYLNNLIRLSEMYNE